MSRKYLFTAVKNTYDLEMNESTPTSKPIGPHKKNRSYYFEGKIVQSNKKTTIGIGIKSDTENVKFICGKGVFTSPGTGIFHSTERCQPGDIIGCRVFQHFSNQHCHCVLFSRNGSVIDCPIFFEGSLPISVGLFESSCFSGCCEDSGIDMNFGDRPFEYSIGNFNFFS